MELKLRLHDMRIQSFIFIFILLSISCLIISCALKRAEIDEREVNQVLAQMKDYQILQDRSWTDTLFRMMERGYQSKEAHKVVEKAFIKFLNSEASTDAKVEIIYLLGPIASSYSVETLLNLMSADQYFDASLHSLNFIQDASIDQKLFELIPDQDLSQSVAIVNVLGHRANPDIVEPLFELIGRNIALDPYIFSAIGNIPTQTAALVLSKSMDRMGGNQKWEVADHLIQVANELLIKDVDVSPYFEKVYSAEAPPQIVYGALRGHVLMGTDPLDQMSEIFYTKDEELISVVIPLIRIFNQAPGKTFYEKSKQVLSAENEARLLIAMADRGVMEIKNFAIEAAQSSSSIYRQAGLKALFDLGDESDVLLLAERASTLNGLDKQLARRVLYNLKGDPVNKKIISEVTKATGEVKEELILSIGHRNIKEADQLLLGLLSEEDEKVRVTSIRVLGMIGKPQVIPEFISRSGNMRSGAARNQMIRALTLITYRIPDEERREDDIAYALSRSSESGRSAMLIEVLGNIANEEAYLAILPHLRSDDPIAQASAIKAFSYWPTDRPLEDLINYFTSSKGNDVNLPVLSGVERLISNSSKLTPDERAKMLTDLLKACKRDKERKIVLSGLGKTGSLITFEAAIDLISSAELVSEAEAAILQNISNMDPDDFSAQVEQYLRSARERSSNDYFKKEIDDWLGKMS